MKCYAKSSENLIVQLANLPPKPPFLSKSFHLFSCTGKTHYLCISSAKNKEQNKTFLPFNFQNIGRQLVQYAYRVTAAVLEPCSSTVPLHTKTNPAAKVETTRGLYSVYRASSGRYINGRGGGPSRPQGEL